MFNNEDNNFKKPREGKVVIIGGRGGIGKSAHLHILATQIGLMHEAVHLVARECSDDLEKITGKVNKIPRNMKDIPVMTKLSDEYFTPPLTRKERREQERKINKRKKQWKTFILQ